MLLRYFKIVFDKCSLVFKNQVSFLHEIDYMKESRTRSMSWDRRSPSLTTTVSLLLETGRISRL